MSRPPRSNSPFGWSSRRISSAIGVEVEGVDLSIPLSDRDFQEIRQMWEESCVLLFRNQTISEDQQVKFAEMFGPLSRTANPERAAATNSAIMFISNIRENGRLIGALPDGEMHFHSDQSYIEKPATGSMLYAMEIPKLGGNTLFANCLASYEDLPLYLKTSLADKQALHTYDTTSTLRKSGLPIGVKSFSHPVFRTHPPTRRKAIYVNRLLTHSIVGIPRDESDDILEQIFDHQEARQYVYEHQWTIGDLLLWDNRSCIHARSDFSAQERRLLRRITLLGEKPH